MQIHEVTKALRREGILDTVKNAITNPLSPVGFATAQAQSYHNQAADLIAQSNAKRAARGVKQLGKDAAGNDIAMRQPDELFAGQKLEQEAEKLATEFAQTPVFADLSTVKASPGHKIVIPTNKSNLQNNYYIDDQGTWWDDHNKQKVPTSQTKTIEKLNNMLDAGIGDEQLISVKETVEPVTPVSAVQPDTKSAGGIIIPPGSKSAAPLTPTNINNSDSDNAIEKEVEIFATPKLDQLSKNNSFNTTAEQVKDKPEVNQAMKVLINTTKTNKKPSDKPKKVKNAFKNYALSVLKNMEEVGTGKMSAAKSNQDSSQGTISGPVPQIVQTQAEQDLERQGVNKQEIAKIKKYGEFRPDVVKNALGLQERLQLELNKLLNEDSNVAITKDIHVKTKLGDYVKRVSDQQWYDPNGVRIDAEKYADYVKKLDATPAAQTQYQNDTRKGAQSVEAFLKSNPVKATAPALSKAVDPLKQMADQQALQSQMRAHDVAQLNQQIADTTQQLRNAQIFGTGQETYLTQQLAQLIAMKV